MVNESDLPQFNAGPTTPISQIVNPGGMPVAHKKAANGLMKRIMSLAKPMPKAKINRKSHVNKPGRKGIEADQKVHIGHGKVKFW